MGLHMDAAEMAKMNRARAALLVKLKRDPYVQWALPFRREEQLEWVREMAIADELTPQEHAHMEASIVNDDDLMEYIHVHRYMEKEWHAHTFALDIMQNCAYFNDIIAPRDDTIVHMLDETGANIETTRADMPQETWREITYEEAKAHHTDQTRREEREKWLALNKERAAEYRRRAIAEAARAADAAEAARAAHAVEAARAAASARAQAKTHAKAQKAAEAEAAARADKKRKADVAFEEARAAGKLVVIRRVAGGDAVSYRASPGGEPLEAVFVNAAHAAKALGVHRGSVENAVKMSGKIKKARLHADGVFGAHGTEVAAVVAEYSA